jgi:hypothetical protein
VARKKGEKRKEVLGFLGVGLDNDDGHQRITRSEEFLLVGGSEQTHEHMQDIAIRFEESLKQLGKRLRDAEPDELIELLNKARGS